MRSQEFLPEIDRISSDDYEGGKKYLYGAKAKSFTPLPGGSGLLYRIRDPKSASPIVTIWDPNPSADSGPPPQMPYEFGSQYQRRLEQWAKDQEKAQRTGRREPQLIAKLALESLGKRFPLPNALQVNTITVDEDYRGRGLAKALYGIVLTVMQRPLVAGTSQTPGGRQNWVSLSQIPGVEINGYVAVDDDDINPASQYSPRSKKETEKIIDTLMGKLGAQYLGTAGYYDARFFAFPVQPNSTGKELAALVNTGLSKVYGESRVVTTGLYAVWNGAA
jgi:GNAT superfamily N-acetyltransferase